MYPAWLVVTALLVAIYCVVLMVRRSIICVNRQNSQSKPKISILFLVRNQDDTVEGLIRRVFAEAYDQPVEIIVVDTGSADKTKMILERLAARYEMLKFVPFGEVQGISRMIRNLCHGNIIYCIDLTSSISYSLMANTIDSILIGSKVSSLYRTRVLYKNDACG